MAESYNIKERALALANKTDSNSISPKEVGTLMYDMASYAEGVSRNGGTLGIRQVYSSVAEMEADTKLVDIWGNPLKKGNLVVIYDGTTEGVDNNKIYAFLDPGWKLSTELPAGYATKEEVTELATDIKGTAKNTLATSVGVRYDNRVSIIIPAESEITIKIDGVEGLLSDNKIGKVEVIDLNGNSINISSIISIDGVISSVNHECTFILDYSIHTVRITKDNNEVISAGDITLTVSYVHYATKKNLENLKNQVNVLSQFDSVPIDGSSKAVQSSGVYKGLKSVNLELNQYKIDSIKKIGGKDTILLNPGTKKIGYYNSVSDPTVVVEEDGIYYQAINIEDFLSINISFDNASSSSNRRILIAREDNAVLLATKESTHTENGIFTWDVDLTTISSAKYLYLSHNSDATNLNIVGNINKESVFANKSLVDKDIDTISENISILNEIEGVIKPTITWDENKFVNKDLNYIDDTSGSYAVSKGIELKKGTIVYIYAKGYLTNVAILSKWDTENDIPTKITIRSDSSEFKLYTTVIQDDGIYKICSSKGDAETWTDIVRMYKVTYPIMRDEDYISFSSFNKWGVIGDSYASGGIAIDTDDVDVSGNYFSLSWPQVLARITGTTCINYTYGGMNTRTWLTNSSGKLKLDSTEPLDLYICALGLNDVNVYGEENIGSLSDIHINDHTQNANTFYGNYGKIISLLKIKSPNCKIIMSTMARNETMHQRFNQAIIDIATLFGIPYVVQNDEPYFVSSFYLNNMYGSHPTAFGYSGMAKAFQRMIERCVKENIDYFFDFKGTNIPNIS